MQRQILCDPQTSGGLLIAIEPAGEEEFLALASDQGLNLKVIGELIDCTDSKESADIITIK